MIRSLPVLHCLLFLILIIGVSCGKKGVEHTPSNIEQTSQPRTDDADAPENRTMIAFGSCSKQYNPNQRWYDILKNKPDLWIWLGDNIYGDTHDMEFMAEKYAHQKADSGYQMLLKSGTEIIGTWDDHDYGVNDGGKFYSKKKESKTLFMDFLDIPEDHSIMDHEGVYQAYDYTYGEFMLKVVLLDTRYFRDTLDRNLLTRAYLPNPEGDVLGEAQWIWFEKEMQESQADLILIGSSIQVIPDEHIYEKWANFPSARERLFELLKKYPEKRTVLLSGDRHIAEISELVLDGLDYPLYDFTSSGLTHTWLREDVEPNKNRVSNFIINLNFGLIIIDWKADGKHEITFELRGEDNALLDVYTPQLFP